MATSDAVGKRSLFRRGLNATRIALAFAVTVVIVTIVVYAVVVVSREEQLHLSVAGGIIHVRPVLSNPTLLLGLSFSVEANNPSARVRFYYTDIWGFILLKNRTNSTHTFTFAQFHLGQGDDNNMEVSPWSMLQRDANVYATNFPQISTYFDELRNNSIITDATLKLNGTLTVGLYSVHNKTPHETFYYCGPLTIGATSNVSADAAKDVSCSTDDPTK